MFNISQYLQKFRNLTSYEGQVKDAAVAVLKEQCGVETERDAIDYRNKKVFIRAHPLIKNEVAMHKKTILPQLRARVDCVIEDIQ